MTGNVLRRVILPIFGPLLLAAQAFPQTVVDEIIARVNSDIILKSELERQEFFMIRDLAAQGASQAEIDATMRVEGQNLLRSLIDTSLLVQRSRDYGIESEANLQVLQAIEQLKQDNGIASDEELDAILVAQGDNPSAFRDNIRTNYLRGFVLQAEVYSNMVMTTEELRVYYDEHLEEFDEPRGVNLAEIVRVYEGGTPEQVAQIRAEMEGILARIGDGEDFFEIAFAESDSTSAVDGGILGYFPDGVLGPEFEAAANGLRRNQVSEIFEVSGAFVIIKLLERHEGGVLSFELARRELESIIGQQRSGPAAREYLTELRREGFVEVQDGYLDTGAPPAEDESVE